MKATVQAAIFLASISVTVLSFAALAKSNNQVEENMAVILGQTGERYPIIGTGGITVSGGHHGFFTSNMKSSTIQIDGSAISAQKFAPLFVGEDFKGAPNGVYFVSGDAVCTLGPAAAAVGQELIVVNTRGNKLTYQPSPGDAVITGEASASGNSAPGKVDRFISDGKTWFKE